jgi:cytochrome b subunit of formate dehydrogenase
LTGARASAALLLLLAAAGPVPTAHAQDDAAVAAANRACTSCHGRAHLGELALVDRLPLVTGPEPGADEPSAPRPGLFVTDDALAGGPHAGLRCVDCHTDAHTLPHPRVLDPVSCGATCHQPEQAAFVMSIHADALARGDPGAPRCQSCHAPHEILPATDRNSSVHPLNVVRICSDCHRQHAPDPETGLEGGTIVDEYLESVHGRGVASRGLTVAARCSSCHGHHDIRAAGDPLAMTARERIPRTCGDCHLGVAEVYAESVHGQALVAGDERAPVCTDCHVGHRITHASIAEHHLDIIKHCGDCHDRPELSGDRRASLYRTYRSSYHGQVTELGSRRAARCSDCHGAHDILAGDDPHSRMYGERRVETCRSCHPRANESFARFDPHADYRDRDRYPLLHAVWLYFIVVISASMGFFGLHSIFWFARSAIERAKAGPAPPSPEPAYAIRRFTKLNRLNHLLVIATFFGLVLTGIPLLFSESAWAKALARGLGGIVQAGIWHRTLAVMLILNFAIHFYGLARAARRYPGSFRDWLIGPNSMLPRWKDVLDCAAMFRWFFVGGPRPRFDRWTYWEKFDYWAEIFGSAIIGGSGLLLWFPEFFARFLPGEVFNVAMVVHGYEALLALGFIFTIHFFNAHLRVEKFPVDDVIFTGSLSEEELRHERPEEYERLVRTGALEALRVPPAPPWQRRVAILIGTLAMAVGVTLVVLIVLAGVSMFRNGM